MKTNMTTLKETLDAALAAYDAALAGRAAALDTLAVIAKAQAAFNDAYFACRAALDANKGE